MRETTPVIGEVLVPSNKNLEEADFFRGDGT
jgi:hypothetical protein